MASEVKFLNREPCFNNTGQKTQRMEKELASQHFSVQISKIKSKWGVRGEGVVSLRLLA